MESGIDKDVILETPDVILAAVDLDGRFIFFNRGCEVVSGYRKDEVMGKAFWDVLTPKDSREDAKRRFAELVAGQRPSGRRDGYWATKGGERKVIQWTDTVVRRQGRRIA